MATPDTRPPHPDDILATYASVAEGYAARRNQSLFELPMLTALERHAPGPRLLDLGCGTGRPLARHLGRRGFRLTGVDGAAPMLARYRRIVPGAVTIWRDMRYLKLRGRFDAILAWDSFFHLDFRAQSQMFPVFAAHAAAGAVLVFSSGPRRGTAIGAVEGKPVFHASHAPLCYRRMLTSAGFEVLGFFPEDPRLDLHSWWLCRRPCRANLAIDGPARPRRHR